MDINRNNYETFFLLYLDGELNPAERTEVDNFLSTHADLQKEFSLLQFTIQRPADTIFEPKELLYRREEKRRVVPIYWTRIAASVMLILAAGWFLQTLLNNRKQDISDKEKTVAIVDAAKDHPVAGSPEKQSQAKQDQTADANPNHASPDIRRNQPDNSYTKTITRAGNNKNKKESGDQLNQSGDHQNGQAPLYQANPDLQMQDATGDGVTVMQKSDVNPELQTSGSRNAEVAPGQMAGGGKTPSLFIAVEGSNQQADYTSEQLADIKTDNAISVIALNDRNKSITGFFKKLTKRAPGNETADNTKKLRVSVFQISY